MSPFQAERSGPSGLMTGKTAPQAAQHWPHTRERVPYAAGSPPRTSPGLGEGWRITGDDEFDEFDPLRFILVSCWTRRFILLAYAAPSLARIVSIIERTPRSFVEATQWSLFRMRSTCSTHTQCTHSVSMTWLPRTGESNELGMCSGFV